MVQQEAELLFKIHGMDCAEEIASLKRAVGPVAGGEDRLTFDLLNGRMAIQPGPADVSPDAVVQAVAKTGMRAEIWRPGAAAEDKARFWRQHGRTILTLTSGLFALAGFTVHAGLEGGILRALGSEGLGLTRSVPLASKLFYGLGILAGAWYVLPKAWYAARRLRPDMNLLMTIAVLGAVAIGEWFEAAVVSFLFSLSLALEAWSIGRARRAIAALLDLAPPTARLLRGDRVEQEVPPAEVAVGDVFLVKPGEKFPLDGRVLKGRSHVNQAPITGESVPASKQPGDSVFAGTINGDGALEVECTKPAEDTTLAHIIRLVEEAQSRRSPSEQWVERFARVYTPTVLALAFLVLIVPPLLLHGAWIDWLYRALVLLVIACPCALVISTPVSIVAALAAAARNGVLIKGGTYVEAPARLRAVAFDKTGTLTEGKPAVVEIVPLNGHSEQELLERAAAMEQRATHPLALAIVAFAKERGVTPAPAEDFEIIQGKGATARFNGQRYWLGSHRYLEERGQETAEVHQRLAAMSSAGRTVVVVGTDQHVCGLIALADTIRPEARQALTELRAAGIEHLILLTGDNQPTAQAIAAQTEVDEVHAELLPADKVTLVERLVEKFGQVGMVGDGVNDAPAMGRATLGIAMGAVGSDAAIETADIALMADDLAKLPWLVHHARRTLRIMRQNIIFSLAIKAVFVVLTFTGYSSLWGAIAADMGASLVVIGNGLRLLGWTDQEQS